MNKGSGDKWIPTNGKKPDLPDNTIVDVKFAGEGVVTGHRVKIWKWTLDGEPYDITHYRIHQPTSTVQAEPVGWQFYEDGKWWNGDDRIKDHRKNTEAAGVPVRDVYAVPQPTSTYVCTVPDDCETLHWRGQILSMNELVSVHPEPCKECGGNGAGGEHEEDCVMASPEPDVEALVETLTELCDEIDNHEIHTPISKTNVLRLKRKARSALAAHHKQGVQS